MTEPLFPYYERELLFIRQLVQEFIRQYPSAAARLLLEPNRSADAHVERVLESFALLAGRLHHKLDDEFPELTEALLGILYPHYLAPVPSLAIVQFELDAARGQLPRGFLIDKGSRLYTQRVHNLPCKFRTGYPVTLWPIQLTSARVQGPPFPPGLQVPPGAVAALRLQLECQAGMTFAELELERLRFYLHGDPEVVPRLYELIFNHALQVVVRSGEGSRGAVPLILSPERCLLQVGFEKADSLLGYPRRAALGYRALTEFFAFPAKFLFVDLAGWRQVRRVGFRTQAEVVVFLDRTYKNVEQGVEAATFRLGCTPVVNLFEQNCEPVPLTPARHEYPLVPDVAHPLGYEVYELESVTSTDPATNRTTEYPPFYSFRHLVTQDGAQVFWHASRHASAGGGRGTEVQLHLSDVGFGPRLPADRTLTVRALCTNRDLPALLSSGEVMFTLEAAAPLSRTRCLRPPTVPLRPPLRRGAAWRLVSHLSLNHLSLMDAVEGLAAFQEILRLYDFSDPEAGQQQLAAYTRQLIEGIVGLQLRRVIGRTAEPNASFARGIEVTLEFDEEKYLGTGVFLFASVLERFLGLYVSVNSFSQLVGQLRGGPEPFRRWPPRAGELPLV
ncbi:MAG: type VI secretion system baseplate subunit TssF [Gemmataceae bacterium]|nr:type VI secretion system baseplate subunit TssF [Gemmataceae bacterium]